MNRRNFLKNSALALFGFSVLPPAETYQRIWKATRKPVIAKYAYNPADYQGEWVFKRFVCSPDFGMAVPVSSSYKLSSQEWKNGAELVACDMDYNIVATIDRIGNPFPEILGDRDGWKIIPS